jgi:hypothetical protein
MSAAAWAALVPPPSAVAAAAALAIVPPVAVAAAHPPAPNDPAVPGAPGIVVRVVGERAVPEGLVSVLSDGERGVPRTLLTLAPEVARPTAVPSVRAPWFVRPFQARTFTPAELRSVTAATVIAFPDLAARRRMTRGERLAWGGARSPGPLRGDASGAPSARGVAPVERAPERAERAEQADPPVASAPVAGELRAELAAEVGPAPVAGELRAELAAEVGPAATALPLDLVDVVAYAWRAFRRGRDP